MSSSSRREAALLPMLSSRWASAPSKLMRTIQDRTLEVLIARLTDAGFDAAADFVYSNTGLI